MTVRPMFGVNMPHALVSSAKRVKLDRYKNVGEEWQTALWDIYRDLGAVHYGMTFKRSAAMRVNYFPAVQAEDQDEPIPTDERIVLEAFDRLGNVSQIVGDFVVQGNVAGEGYLIADSEPDSESFDAVVVSAQELNEIMRKDGTPDYVLRIWNAAPWKRSEPDAPLRSVMAQCEQLLLLNDEISATAMSRVPAGFLLVADELSFPTNAEDYPDTGANADGDPFMKEVIEIVSLAISDPGSATRVAPNVIRGPAELLERGFRYVDISRKMDEVFAEMREELLRQIAGGINLPAEILTGLADLNHWSLWGVDESTAKHHIDPDVLQILQGLTEGYLWPYLEEAGMPEERARDFLFWRDYSDLTSRPMTVEQALALNEAGIVNDEYVRRVANVPEDMAGEGRPVVAEPINPDPRAMQDPPVNVAAAAPVTLWELADIDASLSVRIIEASEAAFHRAMERAGIRVRNKAKKNREMSALLQGVRNEDVTLTLGAPQVDKLQVTAEELIPSDEFDSLSSRIRRMLERAQTETRAFLSRLTGSNIEETAEESEDRDNAITVFIAALIGAATARLFTGAPEPDPADTGEFSEDIATGQMVFELLTRAGGADVSIFTPETPRGLALGERTRAILRDHGYRVESETWDYGDITLRQYPYEPHVELGGIDVLDRQDPRLGGYYPGDHKYCRCRWVPSVLPTD